MIDWLTELVCMALVQSNKSHVHCSQLTYSYFPGKAPVLRAYIFTALSLSYTVTVLTMIHYNFINPVER